MLRLFRGGGVAQLVVGGIVVLIIVVFLLEFRAGNRATGHWKVQCAVELKGTCLDQKDFFAAFGLIVPRGADAAAIKRLGLRKQTLEGLIERELLVDAARAMGLGVSEEAIDAELELGRAHVSLPAANAAQLSGQLGLCRPDASRSMCDVGAGLGVRALRVRKTPTDAFDYKLYEREIRNLANRGPREFKEAQERELVAERLRTLVRSRVRVSADEARFVAERAVARTALVSRDWFGKYLVDASPEAVDRWAFENREQVDSAWNTEKANYTEGCPLVREVVVPASAMMVEAGAPSPERKRAEEARARLVAGEEFASVAADLSSGPSALIGGELGCLTKSYGLGAEELMRAVETLKPREISNVVETPRGFHVLQVTGKLEKGQIEQLGRRQVARGLYVHFASDEAARKFAGELVERVKGGQKLEDSVRELAEKAAQAAGPGIKTAAASAPGKSDKQLLNKSTRALAASERPRFEISAPFGRSGNPLPDVVSKEAIAPLAFELREADRVYEKPIETESGFLVLQLKELTQPDEKERAEVERSLRQYKSDEAVQRYVTELRRKAGTKLKVDASFGEDRTVASDAE
ncbi:MAG TPA: peptidylprolyl isomerase [Polyangiaceae bacterium]|nr:peptidylprolyl isomerase [Polyangiaceae bacterium]